MTHSVTLPSPVETDELAEIADWVRDHGMKPAMTWGHSVEIVTTCTGTKMRGITPTFTFNNERDAIHFKLRWC